MFKKINSKIKIKEVQLKYPNKDVTNTPCCSQDPDIGDLVSFNIQTETKGRSSIDLLESCQVATLTSSSCTLPYLNYHNRIRGLQTE